MDDWQKEQEQAYWLGGVLLSLFMGVVVGLAMGVLSKNVWVGVITGELIGLICVWIVFWRPE